MGLGSYLMSDEEILILDEFLPKEILDSLIDDSREFQKIKEVYYAGTTGFLSDDEKKQIEEIIRKKIPFNFKDFQCRLRKTTQDDQADMESFIHTDHFAERSAIIYLNDSKGSKDEPTGTYFWENKITNSKKMRSDKKHKMFKDILLLNKMTFDLEKWECWYKVEHKANRCVVFPALLFHSPPFADIDMGDRVTLDIFLDIKADFQYMKEK